MSWFEKKKETQEENVLFQVKKNEAKDIKNILLEKGYTIYAQNYDEDNKFYRAELNYDGKIRALTDPFLWYNLYKHNTGVLERNRILQILFGSEAATDIINNKPLNPDNFIPEARNFILQHNSFCEKLCPPY